MHAATRMNTHKQRKIIGSTSTQKKTSIKAADSQDTSYKL